MYMYISMHLYMVPANPNTHLDKTNGEHDKTDGHNEREGTEDTDAKWERKYTQAKDETEETSEHR